MGLIGHMLMDEDQRAAAMWGRLAVGAAILFLVTGIYSCSEIRYSISGERATATVSAIRDAGTRRKPAADVLYTFNDSAGHAGKGSYETTNLNHVPSVGDKFEVIYLPKDIANNTPADRRRWWAVVVFSLMTLVMAGTLTMVWIQTCRELKEDAEAGR